MTWLAFERVPWNIDWVIPLFRLYQYSNVVGCKTRERLELGAWNFICSISTKNKRTHIFSLPGQSPGRAIVLPPMSAMAAAALAKCLSFYIKVFYVMGKALSGELSCSCDRCLFFFGRTLYGKVMLLFRLGHKNLVNTISWEPLELEFSYLAYGLG